MSRIKLKKELQKLSKKQLLEQIIGLYDKNNAVKKLYDFYLNPSNEEELIKKYKKIIRKEFNVENPMKSSEKFSVAKKAITDFKALKPSPKSLADVMLYLPESAFELTHLYGDFSEQFYQTAYNNYQTELEFIEKNDVRKEFKLRAEQCVMRASTCGYGCDDAIADVFYQYYQE